MRKESVLVRRAMHVRECSPFVGTADEFAVLLHSRAPKLWDVGNVKSAFSQTVTFTRKRSFIDEYGFLIAYQQRGGKGFKARPVYMAVSSADDTYEGVLSRTSDTIRDFNIALRALARVAVHSENEATRQHALTVVNEILVGANKSTRAARIDLMSVSYA